MSSATSLTFDIFARDHASRTFDKVSGRAKLLGAAAGLLAIKFGKDSVVAYVDAEKAQTRLSDAFAKFPKLADTNIGRLNALNTSLQTKTKFDDEATASGQAVLAQFNLTGKQIEAITPLLQDYAAKTGQDLPTAATALGRAFLGNTRALKSVGINFKATGDTAKDFATIQGLLSAKVGGFAQKEGKDASGQAAILRNQFQELEESVGSKLVPALVKLAQILLTMIAFVQAHATTFKVLAATLGTLALAVWAVNAAARAYAATQAALNIVLTANPIGLVIVAIALLVAGIILAYKHSEKFRAVVQFALAAIGTYFKNLWSVVRPVLKFIVNAWFTVVGALINGAALAFGWVKGIGPKLKAAAAKFNKFRDEVNSALAGIHDETVNVNVVTHGAAGGMFANKPIRLASGGPFPANNTLLVGEEGPELVTFSHPGHVTNAKDTARALSGTHASSGKFAENITIVNPVPERASDSLGSLMMRRRYALGG